LGHAFAQRQHAQKTLNDAVEDAKDHPFSDLPDKVRSGVHETLEERAARVLSQLIHDLEEVARTDLEDYEHLHWVRILGKRLRYALELFVDCCPPAARAQVYSHVEALQDILGLANDSYQAGLELEQLSDVIRATFPGAWELVRVGFSELQAFHQRRLKNQRAAFAKWWRQWELLRPAEVLIAPAKSAEAAVSLPAGH
jgi:CHAD domain-containing protein